MKNRTAYLAYIAALLLFAAVCTAVCGALPDAILNTLPRALIALALGLGAVYLAIHRGRALPALAPLAGQTRVETAQAPSIGFDDVAANEAALHSLRSLRDYLTDPGKYARLGARMPRGVLLYGPPGTGKTLMARALAGEAGVPIFARSGSDFVQMYAGVGASRVRALFAQARKCGRCVVFIDEIDALGRRRDEAGSEEREQTLNALLSEMSGFTPCEGTLIVGATNRLDALDPALLRPGRFDRLIEVSLPGVESRLKILRLHGADKPLAEDVSLEALARRTTAFSGAALESLLNEAAMLAAERSADVIERADVDRAYLTAVAGADRAPECGRATLAVVALHEAGHALITRLRLPDRAVERVSILPTSRGMSGYSLSHPADDAPTDRARFEAEIDALLAGRAAELLINGAASAGAASDLQKATELACAMALDYGLLGDAAVSMRQLQKSLGSAAPDTAQAVRALLAARLDAVTACLSDHVDALLRVTEALLAKEALRGDELDAIIAA